MGISIGIVGWGEIARDHASHFAASGAQLGAVVSRQKNLDLNVPVFRNLEVMLPHVDAVSVAVPNHLHAQLCLQAIRSRKPVLVEKPLCITLRELNEIEESFRNLSTPVHLGFRLRWNPSMLALKARIRNLRRIECSYDMGIEKLAKDKEWTRQFSLTGGSFFTLGVHALDLARWLAGADGQAFETLEAGAARGGESTDYPLNVWLSGTLPSGVEIVAGSNLHGNGDPRIDLRVDADEGAYPECSLPAPTLADEKVEYAALIANFVRAIETNRVEKSYTEEILQTHRELLMARDLARFA